MVALTVSKKAVSWMVQQIWQPPYLAMRQVEWASRRPPQEEVPPLLWKEGTNPLPIVTNLPP